MNVVPPAFKLLWSLKLLDAESFGWLCTVISHFMGEFSSGPGLAILITSTVSSRLSHCFEPRGDVETSGMRIPETSAESPLYVKDWLKRKEILSLLQEAAKQ